MELENKKHPIACEHTHTHYLPNNIYNVDSFKAIKDIPDNSIDCIYTDVPYLIGQNKRLTIREDESEVSKRAKRYNQELIDKGIYSGFDLSLLDEFIRIMKKINIFIWCSKKQITDIMYYFKNNFGIDGDILCWCKTNPTPLCSGTWLPNIEYCLYFKESGVIYNDGYDIKSKWYISPINKKDKDLYDHPTIKPLDFVKNNLLHVTKENDVVFDPFLGSGTTAVACKEIGRKYLGFEILKEFYDIANDRINGVTQIERREKDAGITNIFDFIGE